MLRLALFALLATGLPAAEIAFTGAWLGAKPEIASGATVVVAVYDRTGTCCGGPTAALAGLVNLRDSLRGRAATVLVAIDATPGVTAELATAAVAEHRLAGIPLLVDAQRATGNALGAEREVTMSYVVVAADGTRTTCASPAQVRRALGM